MSFSIGIVGLPNAGKSSLFNAVTKKSATVSPHPFTTIDPNVGMVPIMNPHLEKLQKIYSSKKTVPAHITLVDVAGLIKGAHKGEGLGNRFLSHIRPLDAVALVLRGFSDTSVSLSNNRLDPLDELSVLETELILSDLEVVENAWKKRERAYKLGEKGVKEEAEILLKVLEPLRQGKPARFAHLYKEEEELIKSFSLITLKPTFYVVNIDEKYISESDYPFKKEIETVALQNQTFAVSVSARIESELAEMEDSDAEIFAQELGLTSWGITRIISAGFSVLNLITFYTGNEKEVRAWNMKKGSTVLESAGKIHSDMARGFIKAEVIPFQQLLFCGSYSSAREKGLLRQEGKDYIVQDNDVILIKFNV